MEPSTSSSPRVAELGLRIVTGLIGLTLLLLILRLGGLWWELAIYVLAITGAIEFVRLKPVPGRLARAGVILGVVAIAMVIARASQPAASWLLVAASLVVVGWGIVPVVVAHKSQIPWPTWPRWAPVALGCAYLGGPLGILIRWRIQTSFELVLGFLAIVWANDIAAYFVGSALGRHKLAPRVSPGKSWEGAAAGVAIAAAMGAAMSPLWGLSQAGGTLFGVVASVASQLGDLFESALKRSAGVKDSGTFFPGHGGVLDRFDGLLFAAPVAYLALQVWGR